MDTKQKFIKLKEYGAVIIFPCHISHDTFKHLEPVTAGFCHVNADAKRVDCFGTSISLNLASDVRQDTLDATKQIFGIEAMLNLLKEK